MEAKLQELTKKIYQEGIEKAKSEGENLINNANEEASKIIEKAKNEADTIIKNARKEADQINNKIKSELKLAGEQALSTLKQKITDILSSSALSSEIKGSTKDKDFMGNIIKEIVTKWDPGSKSLDLNVILPEKSKDDLVNFFKKNAADILSKGLELKFESRFEGGFKITPKDNSFVLSFTDKDFEQFFQSFLRPKTKEILFSGE